MLKERLYNCKVSQSKALLMPRVRIRFLPEAQDQARLRQDLISFLSQYSARAGSTTILQRQPLPLPRSLLPTLPNRDSSSSQQPKVSKGHSSRLALKDKGKIKFYKSKACTSSYQEKAA